MSAIIKQHATEGISVKEKKIHEFATLPENLNEFLATIYNLCVCTTFPVSQWIVKIEIRHRYHSLLLKAKGTKGRRRMNYNESTITI